MVIRAMISKVSLWIGFVRVSYRLTQKFFLVFQKVSSVWFEFKQKCGSFTLREGKLEGTSAIYTLVKLRSVELPPSLQDMAVIS